MAILVVDVQNWVMADGRTEFHAKVREQTIPNIRRLLAVGREHGIEVYIYAFPAFIFNSFNSFNSQTTFPQIVFTTIENFTRDGRDRSLDYKLSNFFVPKGSWDAKVVEELQPLEDEIVLPKTSSSLFNSTNFDYLVG